TSSSRRSGSTFATCAPMPSSAPTATTQPAASGRPGSARDTTSGSSPNETAYGTADHTVCLSHRSYDHADATATRCTTADRHPSVNEIGTHATSATSAAVRTVATVISPVATG